MILLLLLCLLGSARSQTPEARIGQDSLITGIVDRVSPDSVLSSIRRLQAFYTRTSQSESCRAAVDWALERMRAYGCDSAYADEFDTLYDPSAVGVKVGRSNPRRVYIICGHIDDWCYPPDRAPGADDNASGATAALEVCRVLAGHDLDNTVRFICFNAEENSGFGSQMYAWHAQQRGDSILGVLNFDMISHGDTGFDSVRIRARATSPNCSLLVGSYCAMADSYTSLRYHVAVSDTLSNHESDHNSFWNFGFPAIYVREAQYPPAWHDLLDSVGPFRFRNCGTNDAPLAAEVIRAAAATLARLAGARPLAIAERLPTSEPRLSLELNFRNPVERGVVLTYALPPGSRSAQMELRDITGRLIADINLPRPAVDGKGHVFWDATDALAHPVPSGCYICILRVGDQTARRKLLVTRTDHN